MPKFLNDITVGDGLNLALGTTTGTRIGTSTTQKMAFFGITPVAQQVATTDIKAALVSYGLIVAGSASNFNLNGGTVTANFTGTITGSVLLPDGTVSAPSLAFTNETGSGLYRVGTGQYAFTSQGTQLMMLDGSSTTTGFAQDGHVMIKTADTTAGSNVKGMLSLRNSGRNILQITPRSNLSLIEWYVGNSTESRTIIYGDAQAAIPRLDVVYTLAYLGLVTSTTNFAGVFSMNRMGDATTVSAQFDSSKVGFQNSQWTGTAADNHDFFIINRAISGTNNSSFLAIQNHYLGGVTNYGGDHFGVQFNNWRTNTLSGEIGINNSTPTAHLHLVEDNAARVCTLVKAASSQSVNISEWRDSSSILLVSINNVGRLFFNTDVNLYRSSSTLLKTDNNFQCVTFTCTTISATAITATSITDAISTQKVLLSYNKAAAGSVITTGNSATAQKEINFIPGTGCTITVNDDTSGNRVDVTITATGASTTLATLTDVTITSAANNDTLQYSSGSSKWVNAASPTFPNATVTSGLTVSGTLTANTYSGSAAMSMTPVSAGGATGFAITLTGGQSTLTSGTAGAVNIIGGLNGGTTSVGGAVNIKGGTGTSTNGAVNIQNSAGTSIITVNSLGLGFFGATAVGQSAQTADLRGMLVNLGFYSATGGATPLNLNGGLLTSGTISTGAVTATSITNNISTQKVLVSFGKAAAGSAVSSGSSATAQGEVNFIAGTNITLTVNDDTASSRVDVTITSSGGGSSTLAALTDVTITSVANNDTLQYSSGTSKWVNAASPTFPNATVTGTITANTLSGSAAMTILPVSAGGVTGFAVSMTGGASTLASGTAGAVNISGGANSGTTSVGGAVNIKGGGGTTTNGAVNIQNSAGTNVVQVNSTGLGFYNTTAVAQQAQTVDLRTAIINLGLISSTGGATPLNLNGGGMVCATLGVTTSTPQWTVSLGSGLLNRKLALYDNNTGSSFYGFGVQSGYVVAVANDIETAYFSSNASGSVGIKNSSPQTFLDVGGSAASATVSTQDVMYLTRATTGSVSFAQMVGFSLGRYVGPTSFSPNSRLDIKLKNDTTSTLVPNVTVMTLQSNGYVGIGNIAPVAALNVTGPATFTAGAATLDNPVSITPTYNQTSTALATDLLINRVETALGSGAQLFVDMQVSGVSAFSITRQGTPLLTGSYAGGTGVTDYGIKITPTYNQTSTAASTDIFVNRTQTAIGSGAQLLIDLQLATVSKFSVTTAGVANSLIFKATTSIQTDTIAVRVASIIQCADLQINRIRYNVSVFTSTSGSAVTIAGSGSNFITISGATAFTATISGLITNVFYTLKNLGAGVATIAFSSGTYDGATAPTLAQYAVMRFYTDGTNYFSC